MSFCSSIISNTKISCGSSERSIEKKVPNDNEFETDVDRDDAEDDEATNRNSRLRTIMQGVARQVSLDPGDGIDL